tara:strand:- start:328 stop:2103 length:1776 start_codon:yes stop_codon:yes gene_type:complete
MLIIKTITVKNFMSVGNVTQAVKFNEDGLILVLGNNLDLGGDGSRNGTGKTTIINALSYALYGSALYNIKKDNLVNKANNKLMLVTVDFEMNGINYRIERGRKPNIFKFFVDNIDGAKGSTDEMQGEGRHAQTEIENIIGMSHTMFKHIVALNTYTEPFLSMRAQDQREMIEQLLGITQLSVKANLLKEIVKKSKDDITEETYRIKGIEKANEHIGKSIDALKLKQSGWNTKQEKNIKKSNDTLDELEHIDIEVELAAHIQFETYTQKKVQIDTLEAERNRLTRDIFNEQKRKDKAQQDLDSTLEHKCYACGQEIHDEQHEKIVETKTDSVQTSSDFITETEDKINEIEGALTVIGELREPPTLHYSSTHDAYDHQNSVANKKSEIDRISREINPYIEQIQNLQEKGLQEVDWDNVNDMTELKDHQDFLLKLLTNKDSFIRKKIIEQNLQFMNNRLEYYITRLGLPHEVQFQGDLTVSIIQLGQDLDFDNLSRGERNRLILGLSWAFRDVFESMNHQINLICIDELVDSGMDTVGVDAALSVLKKMERDRHKNILLISHRDELIGRVTSLLTVTKENGFTTFTSEMETIHD